MTPAEGAAPRVGIVMGSQSDWQTMRAAAAILEALEVPHEVRIVSAHRTPDRMFAYAEAAAARGLAAIVAGAGGAAHLPGMLAAKTLVPVLGVPVASRALGGLDSLLSIVQMPKGVPVATFAIGEAGAANAALFAVAMLAGGDPALAGRLAAWRAAQAAAVAEAPAFEAATVAEAPAFEAATVAEAPAFEAATVAETPASPAAAVAEAPASEAAAVAEAPASEAGAVAEAPDDE